MLFRSLTQIFVKLVGNAQNKTISLAKIAAELGGGGGGQIAFTKTKAEIDTLIAGKDLVAGALYEITGVHPMLYDDGTTSGTTVYLRAISKLLERVRLTETCDSFRFFHIL